MLVWPSTRTRRTASRVTQSPSGGRDACSSLSDSGRPRASPSSRMRAIRSCCSSLPLPVTLRPSVACRLLLGRARARGHSPRRGKAGRTYMFPTVLSVQVAHVADDGEEEAVVGDAGESRELAQVPRLRPGLPEFPQGHG